MEISKTQRLYRLIFAKRETGVCRVCGCTMHNPCYNPRNGACWWWDAEETICSHCADRGIFTRQEIEHLAERLIEFSKTQKNVTEEVRGPKFEDEDKYGISPGITIGSNCYINFIPVKGDYEY